MSKTLIIAEHDGSNLNPSTAKCASCAAAIGQDFDILVMGSSVNAIAEQAAAIDGAAGVTVVDAENLANPLAVNHAAEVVALAESYSHILGPSTTYGRDLMPRIAALLGVNQVSDISTVEGSHHFTRPIYAGNAIVDVHAPENVTVVATVRVASWKAAGNSGSAAIETRSASAPASANTRYVGLEAGGGERPDLQSAPRVVSAGRAMASEENFEMVYELADLIGAGVGASRAAVDAGYCPNDMQVGQTGKIIAPDLYIAFGISGAIQHITGIKDAGTIVAVNKDADAPIFEVADIGLVADLFTVIPEMKQLLS
ncbi:MAG: electron transfer flavoprotein subunit alpha/FixB family protein [Xanthomonadales bacterium]|nr:FAD-binding protein [Gammaproteobacteria bacterium]MBT8074090.1 FAD-binding protein [Gammaproteobacteria bacterium]NNK04943.1 electron transfer flavoprotein subunit alpha/FixB family protein [Xanthomonadales bacterium]NNK98138.1 electron transfer flavoprotein subunit alpha/FixB family protein [Xanthomonadales bacterium]